jgi:hypothetical protein
MAVNCYAGKCLASRRVPQLNVAGQLDYARRLALAGTVSCPRTSIAVRWRPREETGREWLHFGYTAHEKRRIDGAVLRDEQFAQV